MDKIKLYEELKIVIVDKIQSSGSCSFDDAITLNNINSALAQLYFELVFKGVG